MKNSIAIALLAATTMLTGCTVTEVNYSPAYESDYVYSVEYVANDPNWDDMTYPGYTYGNYPWYGTDWGM